jgi:hypothetical protein
MTLFKKKSPLRRFISILDKKIYLLKNGLSLKKPFLSYSWILFLFQKLSEILQSEDLLVPNMHAKFHLNIMHSYS